VIADFPEAKALEVEVEGNDDYLWVVSRPLDERLLPELLAAVDALEDLLACVAPVSLHPD
jgi:hypothetical protein